MAGFQITITEAGLGLLAEGLSGGSITFTGIHLGDGVHSGSLQNVPALHALRASLPISRLFRRGNQVTLKGTLRFGQVEDGFYWRELGLTAKGENGAEVLYAYGISGSNADYIPGASEATLDERVIQLTVAVAGTGQVTAVLDPSALYVEKEELEETLAPVWTGLTRTLSCVKNGGRFALSGLSGAEGLVSCQFAADAAFEEGDSFTVDGAVYTARTQNGEPPGKGLFAAGAAVAVLVDTAGKTVNFKAAGGGKSPFPAGTTALCRAFRQSGSWTAPFAGKYRFICVGRGGVGSLCQYSASRPAVSGGGGGSGSWCEKVVELQGGEQFTIQLGASDTKLLRGSEEIMVAGKGQNGSGGFNGVVGKGGAGGIASGGDINHNGLDGGNGVTAASGANGPGGDGGQAPDWQQLRLYLSGIYGLGGFSNGNPSENGLTASESSLFGQTLCCGGGGGGLSADRAKAGKGGSGGQGAVLIEYVLA